MSGEPTNAELIASAAAIAFTGRRVIEGADRASVQDVTDTLDAFHEHLTVSEGVFLLLARRLGCEVEVEQKLKGALDRFTAVKAWAGVAGSA